MVTKEHQHRKFVKVITRLEDDGDGVAGGDGREGGDVAGHVPDLQQ